MDDVKKSFESFAGGDFPDSDIELFMANSRVVHFLPNEYFLRAGEASRRVGFALGGLFRLFYTDREGKEFTRNFKGEGQFVVALASVLLKIPSRLSIQALKQSTILSIDYDRILHIAEQRPSWQRLLRKITEAEYLEREKREADLLFYDAKERYRNFKNEHPLWDKKIQPHHIASYLDISPETLSRIRKNLPD